VALTAPAADARVTQGSVIGVSAGASDGDGSISRVEFYAGNTLIGTDSAAPYAISWSGAAVGSYSLTARAFDNKGAATTSGARTLTVSAPASAPPANAVTCANEGQTCNLPAGTTATVWYGAGSRWAWKAGVSGSIACNNATFGDPAVGTVKSCRYVANSPVGNAAPTVALTAPTANASFTQGATVAVTANAADSDGSIARVEFYAGNALIGTATSSPYAVNWNGAAAGSYALTARAFDNTGAATTSAAVAVTVRAASAGTGLQGRYYGTNNLSGSVLLQRVEAVNFNWGLSAPGAGVPRDNFSVRWSGYLQTPATGTYQIQTTSDDGVRVFVNGQRVINNWTVHAATVDTSAGISLPGGQRVPIVVEYQEVGGYAQIQLRWKAPGSSSFVVIPVRSLHANP
jgi:co-chaperonin GroES (HSP10)